MAEIWQSGTITTSAPLSTRHPSIVPSRGNADGTLSCPGAAALTSSPSRTRSSMNPTGLNPKSAGSSKGGRMSGYWRRHPRMAVGAAPHADRLSRASSSAHPRASTSAIAPTSGIIASSTDGPSRTDISIPRTRTGAVSPVSSQVEALRYTFGARTIEPQQTAHPDQQQQRRGHLRSAAIDETDLPAGPATVMITPATTMATALATTSPARSCGEKSASSAPLRRRRPAARLPTKPYRPAVGGCK